MNNENKKEDKLVEIKAKEIDLPTLDLGQYVGKKTKIEKIETREGNFGNYVKVITEKVGEYEKDDKKEPLVASKIFGLQTDKEGQIGWGAETKLGLYLKKMGVAHYDELKGKEVIVQIKTNKEGMEFLDFN